MNERRIRALLGWGLICGQVICIALAVWLGAIDHLDSDHGELSGTISAIMPLLGVHLASVVKRFLSQAPNEVDVRVSGERFAAALAIPAMMLVAIIGVLLYKGFGPYWAYNTYIGTFGVLQAILGASVAIIVEDVFPRSRTARRPSQARRSTGQAALSDRGPPDADAPTPP